MRARSRVTPINTNRGTATSVSFAMMPKMRFGNPDKSASVKLPVSTPTTAKIRAVPPRVNATGKPASNTRITARKRKSGIHSIATYFAGRLLIVAGATVPAGRQPPA